MPIVTKHDVERSVSLFKVLSIILFILLGGWLVYVGVVRPHIVKTPTTAQKAAQINNPTYHQQPHFGGCANMRVYEYYRKEKK